MTCHIIEERMACGIQMLGSEFRDPLALGAKKVASGYIEGRIHKYEDVCNTSEHNEIQDLYEL